MTEETKSKLNRVRNELIETEDISNDARDNLHRLLDAAGRAANGLNDIERIRAVSDAILELSMIEVTKSIRNVAQVQAQVDNSLEKHRTACPFGTRGQIGLHILGRVLPWVATLIITILQLVSSGKIDIGMLGRRSDHPAVVQAVQSVR